MAGGDTFGETEHVCVSSKDEKLDVESRDQARCNDRA
jgi:hypothetical protein